jgi:ElaA protein
MDAVLAEVGDGHCVLDAPTSSVGFYSGHGFVAIGDAYDWNGIEHVPMRRTRRERAS